MSYRKFGAKLSYLLAIGLVLFFLFRLLYFNWAGFHSPSGVGVFSLIGHFLLASPSMFIWMIAVWLEKNRTLSVLYWLSFATLFVIAFFSNAHF